MVKKVSTIERKFLSKTEAMQFLTELGYKVSRMSFHRHTLAGLIPMDKTGAYLESGLVEYAKAKLKPLYVPEVGKAVIGAQQEKLQADAKNRQIMAERAEIKLKLEQGLLIEKSILEEELGGRAGFFKREFETLFLLYGTKFVELVRGDLDCLPAFQNWWDDHVVSMFDIWSQGRSFAQEGDMINANPRPGPLGKSGGRMRPMTGPRKVKVPEPKRT
jgi:hypothetical protein